MTPSSTTFSTGPRSYRTATSHDLFLITETAMSATALLPSFEAATALWRAQEALGRDAPDVIAGGLLDAATDLQIAVGRMLALVPAASEADIAVKESVADQLDATCILDDDDLPIGTALRRSIEADRLRLRTH